MSCSQIPAVQENKKQFQPFVSLFPLRQRQNESILIQTNLQIWIQKKKNAEQQQQP